MKRIWEIIAWVSIACGLAAYFVGWTALMIGSTILVPTEFWFYDAVAAGIFGIFFLIYAVHSEQAKRR